MFGGEELGTSWRIVKDRYEVRAVLFRMCSV